MADNFFKSMFSEGGKISHKRVISIMVSLVICAGSAWTIYKHPTLISDTLHWLLVFVLLMSGVATIAQIMNIWKGTPLPPSNSQTPPEDDTNIGGGTVGNPKP